MQRVARASVAIGGEVVSHIGQGILLLLGVSQTDTERECRALAQKVAGLRIFEDNDGKMNLSLGDVGGGMLVVSQFTLLADCRKGRRPSFIGAARPEQAIPLYELFVELMRQAPGIREVQTGHFGADMQVELCNDGPVTILLDTDDLV